MTYKLLYIDDDPNGKVIADGFNTSGKIVVEYLKPTNFESQLNELVEKDGCYQGLILDLKLDENFSGDRKAYYSATTLALQIRTKVNEGELKNEMPIFLFTTQDKMNAAFSGNFMSEKLFDIMFTKDQISDKRIQHQMHCVIDAYHSISKNKPDLNKILGIESIDSLDKRIFSSVLTAKNSSNYTYAKYILNNLISKPGPLIDELYLAARFGVDIESSSGWNDLKKEVGCAKNSGVFGEVWDRWWMFKINLWWENHFPGLPLASLDARERVDKLKEKLSLELNVAKPLPKAASYRYWTICQGYDAPLDPREGLIIDEEEPLPWQENRYISVEAAIERVKRIQGLKISPLEKTRFENIKKSVQ